jgi:hypothetical protein
MRHCILVLALFFGANSFAELLKSPTGGSYSLFTKGPVQGLKKGEKAFGVNYLAKSLEPKAVKDDAGDLMAAVITEVERGGFDTVIIMATQSQGAKGRSVNTIFKRQPSGMWLEAGVKDTVSERWKAALAGKYAASDQAFKAMNFQKIEALMTPDFFHRLANGKVRTRAEEIALARAAFKQVDSWQTKIMGFYYWRDHLYVVSQQEWSGIIKARDKEQHLKDSSVALDQWNPRSFLLEGSYDVSEEAKPL